VYVHVTLYYDAKGYEFETTTTKKKTKAKQKKVHHFSRNVHL